MGWRRLQLHCTFNSAEDQNNNLVLSGWYCSCHLLSIRHVRKHDAICASHCCQHDVFLQSQHLLPQVCARPAQSTLDALTSQ
jgi:hypothetical protein